MSAKIVLVRVVAAAVIAATAWAFYGSATAEMVALLFRAYCLGAR